MSGKHGTINKIGNDDNTAKTNMMDMWKESLDKARKTTQTAPGVAKQPNEAKASLDQKVRNSSADCETCRKRQYKDESSDGGVSFQAPKHLAASTAGIRVMSHEHEHAAAESTDPGEEGGVTRSSNTYLEYAKCPECGRTYVKGGLTKTTSQPTSYRKRSGFDMKI
ncbi:hypothetical protein LJC63_09620 [Ruminococcaceae bacterium OttesenSCG-928-L11]|nr:hypothetical protein [Ruminococcaceae bacterium OttesenSCG-928-L11]